MKIRSSFVSNSSSSSFILDMNKLTPVQISSIHRHQNLGNELGIPYSNECWNIREMNNCLFLDTDMDNFDMEEFLEKIGVPREAFIERWHS